MLLDTKVLTGSRESAAAREREQLQEREGEREREGEEREELIYVHKPKKTVGEYSVQQPLLPSVNLVSFICSYTHTYLTP